MPVKAKKKPKPVVKKKPIKAVVKKASVKKKPSVSASKKSKPVAKKKPAVVAKKKSTVVAKKKPTVVAKKKSAVVAKKKNSSVKKSVSSSSKSVTRKTAKNNLSSKQIKTQPANKSKSISAKKTPLNKKPSIAEKKLSNKKSTRKMPVEKKTDAENELLLRSKQPETAKLTTPETEVHGEDEHFIPEEGNVPPVTPEKARIVENIFHHREEVMLKQENSKALLANSSRKNLRRTYRMRGGR